MGTELRLRAHGRMRTAAVEAADHGTNVVVELGLEGGDLLLGLGVEVGGDGAEFLLDVLAHVGKGLR